MNRIEQTILLKRIGERLFCLKEEFDILLPNFPTLKGSEFIFTIGWANAKKYIDSDIEFFLKGIHIVEALYKNKTNNNFGFGSLSPTYKIIQQISIQNKNLANELTNWISESGGHYYIASKGETQP
jgi:hypothetical protein